MCEKAWSFELEGSRGRPKLDWKTPTLQHCKVSVKFLDANDRAKWKYCAKSWFQGKSISP